jgi:microcystin-dependent protein
MATPFLGELKLVAFDFAPMGWAFCNGQLLSIAQNQALEQSGTVSSAASPL